MDDFIQTSAEHKLLKDVVPQSILSPSLQSYVYAPAYQSSIIQRYRSQNSRLPFGDTCNVFGSQEVALVLEGRKKIKASEL